MQTASPPDKLRASVIVPAFNAAATIGACVRALREQTVSAESYEIIVVDDASTDATTAIAKQQGAHVITLETNRGRSTARNIGAQRATGTILVFTDADCEPTPTWLAHMLTPFERDAAIVGVKGAYLCRQSGTVARFTQLELEDKYRVMARQATISFIDTYSAAYRRDVFLANDGFDVALSYALLEDQDFSFRLAAQGHKMVFAPQARVYHQHVTSLWRYYQRKFAIGKWKSLVLRRYPERAVNDSRTPLTLKAQFALALLLTALAPLALFSRPLRRLAAAVTGVMAVSGLPLLAQSVRSDRGVSWAVLPLVLVRALALAHGYAVGLWQLRRLS
jgi:glycosyltransferase involved in cell wall biosynthesis